MMVEHTTHPRAPMHQNTCFSHKVLPIIELRAENENEEDLEVKDAVGTLLASLSDIFEDMSSFDEYASEVTNCQRTRLVNVGAFGVCARPALCAARMPAPGCMLARSHASAPRCKV